MQRISSGQYAQLAKSTPYPVCENIKNLIYKNFMETKKLEELKRLLAEFRNSDLFGMGEMEEMGQVDTVIDLVDGAIINNEEEAK